MHALLIFGFLLMLAGLAFQTGWSRGAGLATLGVKVHSRPHYHGMLMAIWALIPALAILGAWGFWGPGIVRSYAVAQLPADMIGALSQSGLDNALNRLHTIASGHGVNGELAPYEIDAGAALRRFQLITWLSAMLLAGGLGLAGLFYARRQIHSRLRARNHVEYFIHLLLLTCSGVAILTTLGIVTSLITEATHFFTFVNPLDFFFGTVWNPKFSSAMPDDPGQYGLLPLLAGTLIISAIAMLVAVPIGLMAAIYLNQYAPHPVRLVAKPVIEILAGIPTIVYGFFALITVGPFLRNIGDAIGIHISATSALTAGIVMGIMIVPFISSLSDDILNQVPRSLHDGAYGLGSTRSEAIRSIVLPAALPGLVGAFLLALSRAIGETMIVVLAAGNAPVLRGTPFEPVSTITVAIVNQLTGDTDFVGPQSLVGFALGLTLFVITLGFNIFALFIVRRFREQYA